MALAPGTMGLAGARKVMSDHRIDTNWRAVADGRGYVVHNVITADDAIQAALEVWPTDTMAVCLWENQASPPNFSFSTCFNEEANRQECMSSTASPNLKKTPGRSECSISVKRKSAKLLPAKDASPMRFVHESQPALSTGVGRPALRRHVSPNVSRHEQFTVRWRQEEGMPVAV